MIEVFGKPLIAPEPPLDRAARWRLAGWGGTAIAAVFLAALLIRADAGRSRAEASAQADAVANRQTLSAQQIVVRANEDEIRRLGDLQRTLNADRDRLMARVNTLERDMTDLSGQIARQQTIEAGASATTMQVPAVGITPALRDAATPPTAVMVDIPVARAAAPPPEAAKPEPPKILAGTTPATTETTGTVAPRVAAAAPEEPKPYGVDLGGATTIAGVRGLWTALKSRHPKVLDGLQPVFAAREAGKGRVQFRLIAGPVEDPSQAAKLCGNLGAVRTCVPTRYDGQTLKDAKG